MDQMVPPPMFDDVSFDSYIPDPDEPSQAAAVEAGRDFVERAQKARAGKKSLFGKRTPGQGVGLYLDGGFGVGKTHLLASIFHQMPEPKAFATFVELTHVVGALGFTASVERLSQHSVICIDEFELDDPGDTMLVSRLLTELTAKGVSIAATSNTLPGQLGEGRFAAQDFLREIRKLAGVFDAVRVDGPDYRHRDLPPAPDPHSDAELAELAERTEGATLDEFDALCKHLGTLHPSKYKALVEGVTLASLHAAKGLEWDAVFLVGLVENTLPVSHAIKAGDAEVEEERRLFYVGVTRAREHLHLSWALARQEGGRKSRSRSRFLDGIAPDLEVEKTPERVKRNRRCRVCGNLLATPAEKTLGRHEDCEPGFDEEVFAALKRWRRDEARAAGKPAYIVFTDATLMSIAEAMPTDTQELLGISGVGPAKIEQYGQGVLNTLEEFR